MTHKCASDEMGYCLQCGAQLSAEELHEEFLKRVLEHAQTEWRHALGALGVPVADLTKCVPSAQSPHLVVQNADGSIEDPTVRLRTEPER